MSREIVHGVDYVAISFRRISLSIKGIVITECASGVWSALHLGKSR